MSSPFTSTLPLVTASIVETQLSSVDLPEPEAPMMPTNSPAATSNETSRRACVTLLRLPYTFSTCRTSSTGDAADATGVAVAPTGAAACAGIPAAARAAEAPPKAICCGLGMLGVIARSLLLYRSAYQVACASGAAPHRHLEERAEATTPRLYPRRSLRGLPSIWLTLALQFCKVQLTRHAPRQIVRRNPAHRNRMKSHQWSEHSNAARRSLSFAAVRPLLKERNRHSFLL